MASELGSMVQSFFGNYKYKKLFKTRTYLPTLRVFVMGVQCEGFSVSQKAVFPDPEEDFYGTEEIAMRDIEDVQAYTLDDIECVRITYKSRSLSSGRKFLCIPGIKNSHIVAETILTQIERWNRRGA